MNKQGPKGIGWCDETWNPVTGCLRGCHYCYARGIAERFRPKLPMGDDCSQPLDRLLHEIRYKSQPWRYGFAPTFHSYRLGEPARTQKPSKIFVCSMADLFGDWVPREWIEAVLNRTQRAEYSHHIYQFLTKNPKRLKEFNPWPSNCWVGTTVTNQADADERLPWLLQVDAPVRFVSHEPLLGEINLQGLHHSYLDDPYWKDPAWENRDGNFRHTHRIDWAIIGAMTGPGAVKPHVAWFCDLYDQYKGAGVPIFMKDNIRPVMDLPTSPNSNLIKPIVQEFPA